MWINLLYCFFALLVAAAAVATFLTPHPFLAAIYLIGIIIGLSAIYFLQGASLVAIMQLILHAGGVLILLICNLLFVDPLDFGTKRQTRSYGNILILSMLLLSISIIGWKLYAGSSPGISSPTYLTTNSLNAISYQLVGAYGLVVELIGILLLITLVGMLYVLIKVKR